MKFKQIALCGLLIWPLLSTPAFADRAGRPGAADARIKTITWHENDVYHLQGHYGFTTVIEFSPKEQIETISIGDSVSWQIIKPSRPNILFVKPLEQNAQTNMTVLTSSRIYSFEMSADKATSAGSDDLTFRLKFVYPAQNSLELANIGHTQRKKTISFDTPVPVTDWNFDYSYSGAKRLRPVQVFDDGTFTYFQFRDFDTTPAIFTVDEQGNESIINFNTRGRYLVVNRVGKQFTLRDGETATCIFNDSFEGITGTENKIVALKEIKEKKLAGTIPVPASRPDNSSGFPAFLRWIGAQPVNAANLNS